MWSDYGLKPRISMHFFDKIEQIAGSRVGADEIMVVIEIVGVKAALDRGFTTVSTFSPQVSATIRYIHNFLAHMATAL